MGNEPKIPKAREILIDALEHNMDHKVRVAIESALQLMHREKHKITRAPVKSTSITGPVRDAIKSYYKMDTTKSTSEIAKVFRVNQGRISEIISGKYDHL